MSTPSSPAAVRRRPCVLRVDGGGQRTTMTATTTTTTTTTTRSSSVDRLLADIAYQWERERRRRRQGAGRPGRHSGRRRGDGLPGAMTTSMTEATASGGYEDEDFDDHDAEAASAYWWTDVFLRYFVFDEDDEDDDEDRAKSTVAADSDDLLFFVRRRRRRKNDKSERRVPSVQHRRRWIAYDTRAYRKQQHRRRPHQQQQHQQPVALLPIGDPAVLWRHTVCLNAIVHRLRYTLTVAVCVHVPRKPAAGTDCHDGTALRWDAEDSEPEDAPEEYDLQLLSRHVHTVFASTSGRRMDAAKGPKERSVYPAVCWAADDYAEAFRTVIVQPGQTVCAELVAAWPGQSVVEEVHDEDEFYCDDEDYDDGDGGTACRRNAVKVRQKQNRAVLFTAAVPYAAVRATYECKMSLYREAERQRRKRYKRGGGKKSSLGAALSASLTALFTGAKDSKSSLDGADFDCYYGNASSADRVEYVTVRGCVPGCDPGWSSDNEDGDFDCNDTVNSDAYNGTKGLAQMAVTLAPAQPTEALTPSCEYGGRYWSQHQQQHPYGAAESDGEYGCEYGYECGGDDDSRLQQRQYAAAVESPYAASEPGDYYDYGWDYETAASSGHQTPQTPSNHCRRRQRRRQFDRQRRRRHRRLSDPCSTSVYDLLYGQPNAQYGDQEYAAGGRRRRQHQQQQQQYGGGGGHHQQQQLSGGYGFGHRSSAAATPERTADRPHRAWSESDGLDRCGFGGGLTRPGKQKPILLPPPPVPYYCAAEAAAAGFVQYVRKSPGGWRARQRSRRAAERGRRERRSDTAASSAANRRRSASAGGNGCGDDTDNDRGGGGSNSDDDGGRSSSDSDGEFVGALAAAAAVGHDPDREWEQHGAAGDPVADWERCDSDDGAAETRADGDAVEWTAEIVAADLRRGYPARNESIMVAPSRTTSALDFNPSWCGSSLSPLQPGSGNQQTVQSQQQMCNFNSQQSQRHRRPPPPQFRPQPLEPPPPPPALSVAFTAVACPWWTVLEDVLLVTSANSGGPPNSSAPGIPLLTFD